ncbi:MAG: hypothetical protein M1828_005826 [Chrysothrix sp. TS-e1954]|nr:MAG: hypothetical protein M1828_005826 [Chrysothrix sp. TS-e1954]
MRIAASLTLATATTATALSVDNDKTLLSLALQPLPLGSITANGWLLSELQTEANGLAGHEHDFYNWVADSSWIGGSSEYSALNEGLPYWFNGLVPLAYGLDDDRLKGQVHEVASDVLSRQADDGWIGPEVGSARNFWGRYPLILGLTQLADANATWQEPVVSALYKFNGLMHQMMSNNYTGYIYHEGDKLDSGNYQWGRARAQDMMLSLMWLYEKHPNGSQGLLWDNMNFLYSESINWADWYNKATYVYDDLNDTTGNGEAGPNYPYEHGVNVGQGFKAAAVYRRLTNNDSLVETAFTGVNWTFTYHGAASGTVIADERLEGVKPYAGSELCTAVETMYSLSYLYQALGNPYYADRAELATFNALPAMLTGDWWAHQYMEQPNQPWAKKLDQVPFFNANGVAQTFGLEPDYPCCAVNFPQGLPKFLSNSYVLVGAQGVAHALLGPATVSSTINGGRVTIDCQTDYPFSGALSYSIKAEKPFIFHVRVPNWALSSSNISVNSGNSSKLLPDPSTGLHELALPAGSSTVEYNLRAEIRTERRDYDTIAVYYGALLYALEIGSRAVSTAPHVYDSQATVKAGVPPQSSDVSFYNTTAWNYAIEPSTLRYRNAAAPGDTLRYPIFAPGNPPNYVEVEACQIDWPLYLDSVADVPPVGSKKQCVANSTKTVKLVPYGSAKLHLADLPVIDLGSNLNARASSGSNVLKADLI